MKVRIPVVGLVLLGLAGVCTAQPVSAAKVRTRIEFSGSQVRYVVDIKNTGTTGNLVSVIIGQDVGLAQRPIGVSKPRGWGERIVEQKLPNGSSRWQVWLSCDPEFLRPPDESGSQSGRVERDPTGVANAVAPGKRAAFTIMLPNRRSAAMEYGSVRLVFDTGFSEVAGN